VRICPWPRTLSAIISAGMLALTPFSAAAQHPKHPLRIDDVLDTVDVDRATLSPDGALVAAVVPRPARDGEVFGRTAYEIDPSRNDVWLITRATGARRNLTRGGADAAGFWCATWSPDGSRLAMLSTQPEGREPRGGNNVHLYIWDRKRDSTQRLSGGAVMTHTRYGSPMYSLDLRGGAGGGAMPHECRSSDEQAPFLWLDDHRLLVLNLPDGQTSALIDQYRRPFDHSAATGAALRAGAVPTVSAMGSGDARVPRDEKANRAILRVIDAATGRATTIADLPTYPFQGALSLVVSPDKHQIAILATIGVIAPKRGERVPHHDDAWQVEKRLGFVDLAQNMPVRWTALPPDAHYPLELLEWAPDSSRIALRARAGFEDKNAALFVASADSARIAPVGGSLMVGSADAGPLPHDFAALWVNDRDLMVQARPSANARNDWWLLGEGSAPVNLTADMAEPPAAFRRGGDGRYVAVSGTGMVALDPSAARLSALPGVALPAGASIVWPEPGAPPSSHFLFASSVNGERVFDLVSLAGGALPARVTLPPRGQLLDFGQDVLLWLEPSPAGVFLRETSLVSAQRRELLAIDTHLADVDWGATMAIAYRAGDGSPLAGEVILPPGYRKDRRYPVIVWVYGGYVSHGLDRSYWLNPYMPGIYNLQLYAAQGYVVLIPSMPLVRDAATNDPYMQLSNGVLPAIDRLIELGIADGDRIGVMGQSFGGYSVYSLITQTTRFKAAAALAGVTDLAQTHLQFDPSARGYPGIEHEKSNNWSIIEAANGLAVPPYEDPARYWRNSPIAYVDRVQTPLLLVHGEFDMRGAMTQADTFFYALYRQGKTARLLRYWGESHSLAQSPANVRNIVGEIIAWFDRYLAGSGNAKARDGKD